MFPFPLVLTSTPAATSRSISAKSFASIALQRAIT